MPDWLTGNEFLCRSNCGHWSAWLGTMYIAGNLGIFAAYMMIPFSLMGALRRSPLPLHRAQVTCWAAFIFCCGIGHLLENVGAFWWPAYHVFAFWHLLTALVSIYTAITFPAWVVTTSRIVEGVAEIRRQQDVLRREVLG